MSQPCAKSSTSKFFIIPNTLDAKVDPAIPFQGRRAHHCEASALTRVMQGLVDCNRRLVCSARLSERLSERLATLDRDVCSTVASYCTKAKGVVQGEFAFASAIAFSPQPVIASNNATTGVVITMYNPLTKAAAIGHIDRITDLDSAIHLLTRNVQPTCLVLLVVEMAAPYENEALNALKEKLATNPRIYIKAIHVSRSLAIDARTGATCIDLDPNAIDFGPNYMERLKNRVNLAHRKIFLPPK